MFFVLFFVLIIAGFSIITSLVLMVESKKKDFAVLLSMGLKIKDLKKIVIFITIIKSSIGSIAGFSLGTLFCFLLDKYQFIELPAIYYQSQLPVHLDIYLNVYIMLSAIIISVIGVFFPLKTIKSLSISSFVKK